MKHMPKYSGEIVIMSTVYFEVYPKIKWIQVQRGVTMHSGGYMVLAANFFLFSSMVKHFRIKTLQ